LEKILDQPQPRISELLNGKISKMSAEKLAGIFLDWALRSKSPLAKQPDRYLSPNGDIIYLLIDRLMVKDYKNWICANLEAKRTTSKKSPSIERGDT